MWERYDVRRVGYGQKTFLHPEVGTMTLAHEVLEVNRTDGQRVVVYSAEPGGPDHDAMTLLDMKAADMLDAGGGTMAAAEGAAVGSPEQS
jgi:hypothetical protein